MGVRKPFFESHFVIGKHEAFLSHLALRRRGPAMTFYLAFSDPTKFDQPID
jgi:hypothetical protein